MPKRRSIIFGAALIAFGLWLLMRQLGIAPWGMDKAWPLLLVLVGLWRLVDGLSPPSRDPDSVWFGMMAMLSGGLLLYITIGRGNWESLGHQWPFFPLFAGISWIVAWAIDRRQISNLVTGFVALVVGAVGLAWTYGLLTNAQAQAIGRFWPLILIAIGIGFLVQYGIQRP